jgi:hypothetical protein
MQFVNSLAQFVRHPICSVKHWLEGDMTTPDAGLRLKYEREYDLLSVWLGNPRDVDTVEVEPGVCVRVAGGEVVGVEVVDAAARLHKEPGVLETPAYARVLLEQYGRIALNELHPSLAR